MKAVRNTGILFSALLLLAIMGCKKKGCTNYYASNFQEEFTKDDGSCKWGNTPQIRGEWGNNDILDTITIFSATGGQFDASKWYVGYEHQGETNLFAYQFIDNFYMADTSYIYIPYSYFGITPDETTTLYLADSTGLLKDQWFEMD
ncbi:hypothetical protein JYT25_00605 [bacterium AH-315-C20]|nr:hypothetical protein [bacterium AH-315-C20]